MDQSQQLYHHLLVSSGPYHLSGTDLKFEPVSTTPFHHFNPHFSPQIPFSGPIADFNFNFPAYGSPQASSLSSVGNDTGHGSDVIDISAVFEAKNSKKSCKNNTMGVRKRYKHTAVIKGQWSPQEDRKLTELVEALGTKKWAQIAERINGRVGKQCRERWHNHLKPDIKKDSWSEEEDKILISIHKQIGNHWSEIAKSLPGRPENTIKNHWNATKRRQSAKRSRTSHRHPNKGHLLHSYIRSTTITPSMASPPPPPPPATYDDHDVVFEPGLVFGDFVSGMDHTTSCVTSPTAAEEGLLGTLVRGGTRLVSPREMDWTDQMMLGHRGTLDEYLTI